MPTNWVRIALLSAAFLVRPAWAQQTQDFYLPVVVNGYIEQPIHMQTTVRIVNLSATTVSAVFEAYGNDGTATRLFGLFPIEQGGSRTTFEIPALSAVEAFTLGDIPSFNGWARLTAPASARLEVSAEVAIINGTVGPHPICRRPSNEILATATVDAVPAGNYGSSFAVLRANRQTAVALVNPSPDRKATVRLSLLDLAGNLVATGARELEPLGRVSESLGQILDDPPSDLMSVLWMQSDEPVSMATIHVLFPDGKFASAPVTVEATACGDALTPGQNPLTGECVVFRDTCIPVRWEQVESCP